MNATAKKPVKRAAASSVKALNLKRMSLEAIEKLPDDVFMASISPRLRRMLLNLRALKGQFKA